MPRGRTNRTDRAREKFIAVLSETCNVSEAARAIGASRRSVYDWRDADADFAAEWKDAEETAADRLEREAWRRAVEGVDKPVTFQGAITATYKDYSDKMLEILLKGHRPEKYAERIRNEHTGRDGGPIEFDQVKTDADAFEGTIARLAAASGAGKTAGGAE